ncbi:probable serine/threonine protein kinase IRE [Selaginella moellendorffii]|uniref:probable serine/threonine protein kinase IRE n=1 Tax=Selaginella moellendorffii TaxID=88036 RepID=UPI000D1C84DE|nr:probable serine/threonine protein kinase IRE [Selaginella moellendorffii]|eukprot:XP_002968173.2 probable serine/threonine protein kinase IRE [Selaginella moellendorffii]
MISSLMRQLVRQSQESATPSGDRIDAPPKGPDDESPPRASPLTPLKLRSEQSPPPGNENISPSPLPRAIASLSPGASAGKNEQCSSTGFESPRISDFGKDTDSPRFQALLQLTSGLKKTKLRSLNKSFEVEAKDLHANMYWRPHSFNDVEEIISALREKFNLAKEEVNAELAAFELELKEILRTGDVPPGEEKGFEELLAVARACLTMTPFDFQQQCERVVQALDEKRQEQSNGLLKQLFTRILFILTRCTRLLQFRNENGLNKDGCLNRFPRHPKSDTIADATDGKDSRSCPATLKSLKLEDRVLNKNQDENTAKDGSRQLEQSSNGLVCRICELRVPAFFFEGHSRVCAAADRCDHDKLGFDDRLNRLAETLEKVVETCSPKSQAEGDSLSPKRTDDNTPRSPFSSGSMEEADDVYEIEELAYLARCVARVNVLDESALEHLSVCSQNVEKILHDCKAEGLTAITYGERIRSLVRQKYLEASKACEHNDCVSKEPAPLPCKHRTSIEDFEIIKPISRGAFGRVFLARKKTTGDLFAVKVLRKSDMIRKNAVRSVQAERNILISARNPFVVRFFYSFTCSENLYLVMEYLNGGDLYSLLMSMGCLEEDMARVYIAELVLALEYLHSLGVVHRDLKPGNILIAHDGHIKLTDFGLSRMGLINSTDDLAIAMNDDREHNQLKSAVGTPDYLAPEILLGTEHDHAADWWSVGIILYEFLTGVPPFNAEHPQIIFDNILNKKISWPRVPEDVSYDACDLINRLLTDDPKRRLGYRGAGEVKAHPFFKDVKWDMLAQQKAAFVPCPSDQHDTSYFNSRSRSMDSIEEEDSFGSTCSMDLFENKLGDEADDDCHELTEFGSFSHVTFSNFSFKNLSQLASINYDLLVQNGTGMESMGGRLSSP